MSLWDKIKNSLEIKLELIDLNPQIAPYGKLDTYDIKTLAREYEEDIQERSKRNG